MKVQFKAKASNGVFSIGNREFFDRYLKTLADGNYSITIEKAKKKRSLNQNRYYFGVVLPILLFNFREMGFNELQNVEQVHDIVKVKFLTETMANENGEFLQRIKSTTELSTSQFMDFIAEIQQWASEQFNITIPDPNQVLEINL